MKYHPWGDFLFLIICYIMWQYEKALFVFPHFLIKGKNDKKYPGEKYLDFVLYIRKK